MANSIFFHNAADQNSVGALTVALGGAPLLVASSLPKAVQFGARVVVVWSRHAAADYQDDGLSVPSNAVVVQLDDTPLPAGLAALRNRLLTTGDWTDDALRLHRIMSGSGAGVRAAPSVASVRVAPSAAASKRPDPFAAPRPVTAREAPVARQVGAVRRRQAQSASVVTAAGAMGTLAAIALGAVVPTEQFITPSFASPNPLASSANDFVRHEHLAEARQLAADARFQGVLSADGAPVAFSAEEIGVLNQQLLQSEQTISSARGWSDQAMARLQSLLASEPAPMPSMAEAPQGRSPQLASMDVGQPLARPASAQVVLRDRFVQIEPIAYAVDRLNDTIMVQPAEAQPLASVPMAQIEG